MPKNMPLPALSGAGLDRDYLSRAGDIAEVLTQEHTQVLVLHAGLALGDDSPALTLLPVSAIGSIAHSSVMFLGRLRVTRLGVPDGSAVVALLLDQERAGNLPGQWLDLRKVADKLPDQDAGMFTAALALANWHDSAAFSPLTGKKTRITQFGWVRVEENTGREHFPRTDPAVIVAVLDDEDRLLLGANTEWDTGRFSLLAGFVEPGEALEAAIEREIFEEAGVRVGQTRYRGSQPWPFPASLMLGFTARIVPGTSTQIRADGTELRQVRWFSRAELLKEIRAGWVVLPPRSSIARTLIEDWFGEPIAEPIGE